jgi:hypothetical protein
MNEHIEKMLSSAVEWSEMADAMLKKGNLEYAMTAAQVSQAFATQALCS